MVEKRALQKPNSRQLHSFISQPFFAFLARYFLSELGFLNTVVSIINVVENEVTNPMLGGFRTVPCRCFFRIVTFSVPHEFIQCILNSFYVRIFFHAICSAGKWNKKGQPRFMFWRLSHLCACFVWEILCRLFYLCSKNRIDRRQYLKDALFCFNGRTSITKVHLLQLSRQFRSELTRGIAKKLHRSLGAHRCQK